MAITPGSRIGLTWVTRGLISGDPEHGENLVTHGLFGGLAEFALSDIEITPITPIDGAADVSRSVRFVVRIRDPNVDLNTGTMLLRYRQEPFPPESVDGWVNVLVGTTFQPGFDGGVSQIGVVDYFAGEQATVEAQPLFGLLPGSTGTLEMSIEDSLANVVTETWTFTVADDARSVNVRDHFYRFRRQGERYGWDALIVAKPTYNFQVDPAITGADLEVDVNESLVADFGDQMSESPFDLDILNNTRQYRLLAKPIEYPRDSADAQADSIHEGTVDVSIATPVFADRKLPDEQHHEVFTDANRREREFRYYTLFILVPPTAENPDWFWAYADNATFAHAFAYGRYGHSDKLYSFMPEAWQMIDGELP